MEDAQIEEVENNKEVEVAPALIAVHPVQNSVALAVGSDLRVFDLRAEFAVSLIDESSGPLHKDSIRAIRFGFSGKLFVSAGDDKLVKVWNAETWRCLLTVCSEKRVTAVAISNDGLSVCYSDKFGVVWCFDLDGLFLSEVSVNKKATPLLGHYCSIVTSLEFSPDGKFILSADRDFKIRVTVFPRKPLDGAHEIQCFCLGHTEFISCLAFLNAPDYPHGFLISGSGDSTVRLWDYATGELQYTCQVGTEEGLLESDGSEESSLAVVTDICASSDGTLVAVAIQGLCGIALLACDVSAKTLSVAKVISISGETFIPTSLGCSSSSKLLWMVTGISNLQGFDSTSLARVKAMAGFKKSKSDSVPSEPTMLEDKEMPGGEKLLQELQGSVSIENHIFSAAAEALKTAMCDLLIKKQYSSEKRELRKRTRNDRKLKSSSSTRFPSDILREEYTYLA